MYEPTEAPTPFEKTEIDTAMDQFISEAQKEFAPADELAEAPVEVAPSAPAPTEEPQNNTVEAPETRGLERLVAREVELREREARLSGTEKEMEALRARLAELEPRALTPDKIDQIKFSPSEGLRALGLDPDEVIKAALVEKLGDKANDPETRALLEQSRMRKEMMALRAQVQEAERRQAAAAYYSQISNGALEYVNKVEGLSQYPSVAQVAKSNPQRVYQEIMEEITRDAQVRATREPNGDVISFDEAAKRVEARWSEFKGFFSQAPSVPANAGTPVPSELKAKTIVEAEKKSPPSTMKPPEKPLAPWLQKSLDEEEAIRAALMEYKRAEGQK